MTRIEPIFWTHCHLPPKCVSLPVAETDRSLDHNDISVVPLRAKVSMP